VGAVSLGGLISGLVIPTWAKYAALGAVVVALWGHGYRTGTNRAEARLEAVRAKEQLAAQKRIDELIAIKEKVNTVYMDRVRVVEQEARVITKEVTKYVTEKADRECTVPAGFVRLWDRPLNLSADANDPAPGGNDAPSGLALSAIARDGVIEAKRRFEINRQTLLACQAWAGSLSRP